MSDPVFDIEAREGQARRGVLRTAHGEVPTPNFMPVATYGAVRGLTPQELRAAGAHILLAAYVPGEAGGTGATVDWAIAAELAQQRHVTLAGGLTPDNVADAVRAVGPYCVDVASGVESSPGVKEPARVRAFIAGARVDPDA